MILDDIRGWLSPWQFGFQAKEKFDKNLSKYEFSQLVVVSWVWDAHKKLVLGMQLQWISLAWIQKDKMHCVTNTLKVKSPNPMQWPSRTWSSMALASCHVTFYASTIAQEETQHGGQWQLDNWTKGYVNFQTVTKDHLPTIWSLALPSFLYSIVLYELWIDDRRQCFVFP